MKVRAIIYFVLVLGSVLFRAYERDGTGVVLSLLVMPMCYLMYKEGL